MNLSTLDFSNRLPFDFQKTVEMPVFPKLRSSKKQNKVKVDEFNHMTKTKSNLSSSIFSVKKLHSSSKYSMWTEIKIFPFSKSISSRSYHSAILHEDRY